MASDALGSVTSHQPDNQSTYDRDHNDKPAQVVAGRRYGIRLKSLVEKQICKQADQFEECECNHRAERADDEREGGNDQKSWGCCEITESVSMFLNRYDVLHIVESLYRITMRNH